METQKIIMLVVIGLLVITNILTFSWVLEQDEHIAEAQILIDDYQELTLDLINQSQECGDNWYNTIMQWNETLNELKECRG